jgi:hypothetical protein
LSANLTQAIVRSVEEGRRLPEFVPDRAQEILEEAEPLGRHLFSGPRGAVTLLEAVA